MAHLPIEPPVIEASSRGELDRQAVAARLGRSVSVADLILALRAAHLPLPRDSSALTAEDQAWLTRWLSQAPEHGTADRARQSQAADCRCRPADHAGRRGKS